MGARALFWVLALGVAPLVAFFTALAAEGSDVLQWVLLGLPPASAFALGWFLRAPVPNIVTAAVLSTVVAGFYVLVLLWYLFEVVGVS